MLVRWPHLSPLQVELQVAQFGLLSCTHICDTSGHGTRAVAQIIAVVWMRKGVVSKVVDRPDANVYWRKGVRLPLARLMYW